MDNIGNFANSSEDEVFEKYHEQRRLNLKLITEKRELLLQLQKANGGANRAMQSEEYEKLQRRVEELERQLEERDRNRMAGIFETPLVTDSVPSNTSISAPPPSICNCSCSEKLKEAIAVNHQWSNSYQRLLKKFNDLDRKRSTLEDQLKVETEENTQLKELVNSLENDLQASHRDYARLSSLEEVCSKDDVEALKLQMSAYKEDFFTEKDEKEKAINEYQQLKGDLREAKRVINFLSDQVTEYQNFATKISRAGNSLKSSNQWDFDKDSYSRPNYRRQLSPSLSMPADNEMVFARSSGKDTQPTLRRSDSDLYKGSNVVRDL